MVELAATKEEASDGAHGEGLNERKVTQGDCATYKNGSDLEMCLEAEELILPKEPVLAENPISHQWKMWDMHVTAVIKSEETLRQNTCSLYAVVMSLCDSNMEDKVKAHKDNAEIKHTRNTINLLQVIKQDMYLNGS